VCCSGMQCVRCDPDALMIWQAKNMLQCAAVYCSVLPCVAMCCSVLQCVAVCKMHSRHHRCARSVTVCCRVLPYDAVCHSVLQCVALCCSV